VGTLCLDRATSGRALRLFEDVQCALIEWTGLDGNLGYPAACTTEWRRRGGSGLAASGVPHSNAVGANVASNARANLGTVAAELGLGRKW
jgi:hypothetical protein